MLYLVLYDKTFEGLCGTVDRIYDDHYEAELYCTAQNDATTPLDKSPITEHWIVIIDLNEVDSKFADRVYKPAKVKY